MVSVQVSRLFLHPCLKEEARDHILRALSQGEILSPSVILFSDVAVGRAVVDGNLSSTNMYKNQQGCLGPTELMF